MRITVNTKKRSLYFHSRHTYFSFLILLIFSFLHFTFYILHICPLFSTLFLSLILPPLLPYPNLPYSFLPYLTLPYLTLPSPFLA